MEVDDNPQVRIPPPLLYLGTLLAGLVLDSIDLLPARLDGLGLAAGIRLPLGAAIAAAGFALILVSAGLFKRAGTNLPPWQPSTSLVLQGPYKWSRNPIYLGMTLTYLGLAIAFDSLIALLLLPVVIAVMQTQVIAREERYLERRFGADYLAYKKRVRRWL